MSMSSLKITWFGKLVYYCFPYRYRVIADNMAVVFKTSLDDKNKKLLIQAFYSHIFACIKEALMLPFLSKEALKKKVVVKNHTHLLSVANQGKGVLILTAHMGNWEFAPLGGILHFTEYQGHFHFIRRTLGIKWLEKLLFHRYHRFGLHVIPKKNALSSVMDALEANHAVVFVMDQHASLVNRDGIAVEFFGKKAGTYRSLASISANTGVPVVPATGYREADGTHVLVFGEPIYPITDSALSNQARLYINTKQYNDALEKIILAHPAQWMWLHKRWKLKENE
jgi:KDO2-lipid IV(A) lauroyltransferase